ncbi:MAG: hypothetical protein WBV55_02600, partial [Candidatus Sulfotelmatobacter sp.]
DCERAVVGLALFQLERNGALFGVQGAVRSKTLDTADIVRDAWFRQLRSTCVGGVLIFIAFRKKLQAISAVIGKPRRNIAGSFPVATSTIPITRVKT